LAPISSMSWLVFSQASWNASYGIIAAAAR
jgi:hypothetical protein